MKSRLELTIDALAPSGEGIAHITHAGERRAVFVPRTAPGDVVLASVDLRRRPASGELLSVVSPSALRRDPPCPQADRCGGCDAMHLTAEARRSALERTALDPIRHALGRDDLCITMHDAPSPDRYRVRARVAFRAGKRPLVGYRARASHDVVDAPSCVVLSPALEPALSLLRRLLAHARGDGEARLGLSREGLPVASISLRGDPAPPFFAALDQAISQGQLAGASLSLEGAPPLRFGDPTAWQPGPDGQPLETPSFGQANPAVMADLTRTAAELARADLARVLELYAGAGTLTVALAPRASKYTAVEADGASLDAARRNLARRSIDGVKLLQREASALPPDLRADVVVLDPPREGAAPAIDPIARCRPDRIVYVSCNPATLARDLARFASLGYRTTALHGFDMFPSTSHVEVVALLERANALARRGR